MRRRQRRRAADGATRCGVECRQESRRHPRGKTMKRCLSLLCGTVLLLGATAVRADSYGDTIELFRSAGESAAFFHNCYGYAVFPTVGKGGLVVGGAHGTGRV